MAYPRDTAELLLAMGFGPDDYVAISDGPDAVRLAEWRSPLPQPTVTDVITFSAANPNAYALKLLTNDRELLISWLVKGPPHAKLLRALMLVLLDELNLHAAKINAILTAIDTGGTLAQVKTNIAAIPDYPTRTKANLLTALTATITAGDADN